MTHSLTQLTLSATTATLAATLLASSAFAGSLVPKKEGEVEVYANPNQSVLVSECGSSCISLPSLIDFVVSETDTTTGSRSRLFVDDVLGTASNYGSVNLEQGDAGTNSKGFWYRPVEETEEDGQLEVGTYTFYFKEVIPQLFVDFFDTERNNQTGILKINEIDNPWYIPKGSNGNIQTYSFLNVDSITLKLGYDFGNGTGDGVNFRLATSVPEPGTLLGLGVATVLGACGLRKRSA